MIKVVCAYCGIQYGTKDDGREAEIVSHGACESCGKIELAKIEAMDIEEITRAA